MDFKLKRIKTSFMSSLRYCKTGYWGIYSMEDSFFSVLYITMYVLRVLLVLPYLLLSLILSILIAPFVKEVDQLERGLK